MRERTGRWPLSVSTDRLGLTAMRCAGLLRRIEHSGIPIDRAGTGRVVEVYPGATLRLWGFDTTGYRTLSEKRGDLLAHLEARAPWLETGTFGQMMIASGDAFDAVIAAMAARSAAQGSFVPPPVEMSDAAGREGWIALPNGPIDDLIRG